MSSTYRIIRSDNPCPDVVNCETILRFDDAPAGTMHLIIKEETDPDKLAAVQHLIGAGELLGYTKLIPEVS